METCVKCDKPRKHERTTLCQDHWLPALEEAVREAKARGAKPLPHPCHLGHPCSCTKAPSAGKVLDEERSRIDERIFRAIDPQPVVYADAVRGIKFPEPIMFEDQDYFRGAYEGMDKLPEIKITKGRATEKSTTISTRMVGTPHSPTPLLKTPYFRALYQPPTVQDDRLARRVALTHAFREDSLRPSYLGPYKGFGAFNWTLKHFGFLWDFKVPWTE